jgi:hypothetical protein
MKMTLASPAALFIFISMLAQTTVERPFVMRAEIITDDPRSTLEDTCVLVYSDGRYRMEKSFDMIAGMDPRKTKVYLGTLPDNELQDLESVLHDEKFVQIKTTRQRLEISGTVDALVVTVPREDSAQLLVFKNSFERKPFEKDLKAFLNAFENIVNRKVAVAKTEKGNDCEGLKATDRTAPSGISNSN